MLLSTLSLFVACLPAGMPAVSAAPAGGPAWDGQAFVVHEWGTFTSVLDAGGVVLEGLTHEDGDLPPFVHELGGGLSGVSPKMETPVVYVYSPEEIELEVAVRFPRGRITHWYPSATLVNASPRGSEEGSGSPELKNGFITWGRFGELSALGRVHAETTLSLAVGDEDPWRFSRQVQANDLRVTSAPWIVEREGRPGVEREPSLFYRGLGDFPLPLRARVSYERTTPGQTRCTVRMVLENERPEEPLTGLVLVCVRGDRAGFQFLPDLATPLDLGAIEIDMRPAGRVAGELQARLLEPLLASGLYLDEALAMTNTWRHAWFGEEGLRLLYVVPHALVERELPLRARTPSTLTARRTDCEPREPDELVRVFVARTELLAPQRLEQHDALVHSLLSRETGAAETARELLQRWGRFAVPFVDGVQRRVANPRERERVAGLRAALFSELTQSEDRSTDRP